MLSWRVNVSRCMMEFDGNLAHTKASITHDGASRRLNSCKFHPPITLNANDCHWPLLPLGSPLSDNMPRWQKDVNMYMKIMSWSRPWQIAQVILAVTPRMFVPICSIWAQRTLKHTDILTQILCEFLISNYVTVWYQHCVMFILISTRICAPNAHSLEGYDWKEQYIHSNV